MIAPAKFQRQIHLEWLHGTHWRAFPELDPSDRLVVGKWDRPAFRSRSAVKLPQHLGGNPRAFAVLAESGMVSALDRINQCFSGVLKTSESKC